MEKNNFRKKELVQMGHASAVIEQYCHCKDSEAYKTKEPNGPFIIPYKQFMEWIDKNKKSH